MICQTALPTQADANLLFGMLALQMDFIGREQLIAGMQAWVNEKTTSLADHLVRIGALKSERKRLLEPLVAEHVRQHNGDLQQSLAAIDAIRDLQRDLNHIDDPAIQDSVQRMAATSSQPDMTCMLDTSSFNSMRFQILRPHARGGLGEVFVAKDAELGREVALKEILFDKSDDTEARSRFIREAEITGGLEHPGVVPVYSLGTYPDGRPYYAMRFIRGQTLHDAIRAWHAPPEPGQPECPSSEKNLELRRLLQRFIDVCEAIDYAHSRGVLHRDLKPGNIMLGRYGETLVVDWGLAKAGGESHARPVASSHRSASADLQFAEPPVSPTSTQESAPTQMGFVPGTPAYMSPEHALGRLDLMGPASDVFSLGATLYHLLTGRPPYVGKDVQEVQRLAQAGNFTPPVEIASVPRQLDAICRKALATLPAERYANCSELASEIERYLADEPVLAYREPLRTRISRWMRRHSRLVGISVVCCLIVPICLGSGLFVAMQQKELAHLAEDRAELGQLCAATALAHNALSAGDHPTAARALKRVPEDRRSWVYQYLFHQLAFHGVVESEPGGITCLAFDAPSERLAYGTQTGELCLRHSSGSEFKRVQLSSERPSSTAAVAWSTSGSQIAVATGSVVQILNSSTLVPAQRLQFAAQVSRIVVSPDGRQIVVTLQKTDDQDKHQLPRIVASTVTDGLQQWTALPGDHGDAPTCFALDGSQLVVGAGNEIVVLSATDGSQQQAWKLPAGCEATTLLSTIAENELIVGTNNGTAMVFDVATGNLIRRLDEVSSSVIGAKLVAAETGESNWQEVRAGIVASMALEDSQNVVLISAAGDVWIVNNQSGEIRKKLTHKSVLSVAGSLVGSSIAMADQDEVFLFDAKQALRSLSRELRVFPAEANDPALSPDGKTIAFAMADEADPQNKQLVVHDVDLGGVRWTAKVQFPHDLGFSPDGRLLVALCDDLRVYDSQTGACLMQSPKLVLPQTIDSTTNWRSPIRSAVIDADNRYVAVDGDTLQLWEIASGRKVQETATMAVHSLQLSATGTILGNVGEGIGEWRIPDLKEFKRVKSAQNFGDLLGISRDNNIVQRSGNRLVARAWPSGETICDFEHDGLCQCIDFNVFYSRIVTGGADGKINVWHYPTGEKLLELDFSRTVAAVRFSLDGSRLIAIDRQGKVGIWDSNSPPNE